MAYAGSNELNKRIARIEERNKQLARGGVIEMRRDGLVIARPMERRAAFPIRSLFILLAGIFLFKAWIFASMGAEVYTDRVARLEGGTQAEQIGAWLMTADPATVWIAEQLSLYIK